MIHALSFEGRVYGYRVTAVACRINPAQPNYYQGSYHIHSLTCTCYIWGKRTFGGNDFRGKWSSGEKIYYPVSKIVVLGGAVSKRLVLGGAVSKRVVLKGAVSKRLAWEGGSV